MKTTEVFSSTYKDKATALVCTPHSGQRPTDEIVKLVAFLLSEIDLLADAEKDMSALACGCIKCQEVK